MKLIAAVAVVSFALPTLAQRIVSPEVNPDGHVTFRLRAPLAQAVQVHCEGVSGTNMLKGTNGVWTFTTDALQPDIYVYSFTVDGLRVVDPNNSFLKYNLLATENQVRVPGPESLPWEINDVPRGQLHRNSYRSRLAGDDREFVVYTPPGYDPVSRKRYPVLYLLHGYSDDTSTWISIGRANVILDNLIARGQAKPMIVVMPLGYGTMEAITAGWEGIRRSDLAKRNFELFRETLLSEVMPQAEGRYQILGDRNSRAIAGNSMGGSESLQVGLNALERFAWIGAFSSGGLNTNFPSILPSLDDRANRRLRLLWVSCGREDRLLATNKKFEEWLTAKGVEHTWRESPGQHSFRLWRRNLGEFVPLLFRVDNDRHG